MPVSAQVRAQSALISENQRLKIRNAHPRLSSLISEISAFWWLKQRRPPLPRHRRAADSNGREPRLFRISPISVNQRKSAVKNPSLGTL